MANTNSDMGSSEGGVGLNIGSKAYRRMTTNNGTVDPTHKRHLDAEVEHDKRADWVEGEDARQDARNDRNFSHTPNEARRRADQRIRDKDAARVIDLHLPKIAAAVDDPTVRVDQLDLDDEIAAAEHTDDSDSMLSRSMNRRMGFGRF